MPTDVHVSSTIAPTTLPAAVFDPAVGPRPWPWAPLAVPVRAAGRDVRPTRGVGAGATGLPVGFHEPFDRLDLRRWRHIGIRSRTHYTIAEIDGARALRAESHHSSSILVHPVRFDPRQYPWVQWRWRVEELVANASLAVKDRSDAAARLYVYFDTPGLPWRKRAVQYVWATEDPVGSTITSPFGIQVKIIVVESGPSYLNAWKTETRNVLEDYRASFREEPPAVVAVGFMTDSDSTGNEGIGYLDEIRILHDAPVGAQASGVLR